jgi:DNA-binding SARP family transcriptional activator
MIPINHASTDRRQCDRRTESRRSGNVLPWPRRSGSVGLFIAQGILLDDGQRSPTRLRDRAAVLLALLAIEGPRHRQAVAALLWPDSAASLARNNLRTLLHRLVRRHGLPLFTEGEVLALDSSVVQVHHENADELAERVVLLGPERCALLPDLSLDAMEQADAWLAAARMRHREGQLRLLSAALAQAERLGNHKRRIAMACAKVLLDPTSEASFRELMQAHLANGDRGAALAAYERCREVLLDALGVAPESRTQELQLQILQASAVTSLAEAAPVQGDA